MNIDILKQFDMTRDTLMKSVQTVSEDEADIMPHGFSNTIRWQLGHILFATDRLFSLVHSSSHLPAHYSERFKSGTSPKEWGTDIPSLRELFGELERQKAMVRETFASRIGQMLETPYRINAYGGHEFHSVGEILNFLIFHEAMHMGYINAMKRMINGKGMFD